jgi:hypothetical protein
MLLEVHSEVAISEGVAHRTNCICSQRTVVSSLVLQSQVCPESVHSILCLLQVWCDHVGVLELSRGGRLC